MHTLRVYVHGHTHVYPCAWMHTLRVYVDEHTYFVYGWMHQGHMLPLPSGREKGVVVVVVCVCVGGGAGGAGNEAGVPVAL